jgi:hypothetical protein
VSLPGGKRCSGRAYGSIGFTSSHSAARLNWQRPERSSSNARHRYKAGSALRASRSGSFRTWLMSSSTIVSPRAYV